MRLFNPSKPYVLGLVILAGGLFLAPAPGLPAQDVGCIAVDQDDMPRACTFLEEHGACLWAALDSHEGCRLDAEGFLESISCDIGVQIDLLACNFGLPWRLIQSVIN